MPKCMPEQAGTRTVDYRKSTVLDGGLRARIECSSAHLLLIGEGKEPRLGASVSPKRALTGQQQGFTVGGLSMVSFVRRLTSSVGSQASAAAAGSGSGGPNEPDNGFTWPSWAPWVAVSWYPVFAHVGLGVFGCQGGAPVQHANG
jgi:hypothetical protein